MMELFFLNSVWWLFMGANIILLINNGLQLLRLNKTNSRACDVLNIVKTLQNEAEEDRRQARVILNKHLNNKL